MTVTIFASGSTGNCLLFSQGGTHVLIDAGISLRRLEKAITQSGQALRDIGGVLITHEHSDHISGLKMLLKYTTLPVYAPHTVANRLFGMLPECYGRLTVIPVGEDFALGEVHVRAFHTPHDTDESVGYRVSGDAVFALATDMGCVTEEVLAGLSGADTALIEANHDLDMLYQGRYPFPLKRRIASDRGHLSNAACRDLARALAADGTRQIILGHLSRENNSPRRAMETVSEGLAELPCALYVAPELGRLEIEV